MASETREHPERDFQVALHWATKCTTAGTSTGSVVRATCSGKDQLSIDMKSKMVFNTKNDGKPG